MRARTTAAALATAALALAALTGCGGDSKADSPPTTPTTAPTTNADGTTVAGTVLKIGDRARVAFKADKKHDSQIKLAVTKVEKGKVKDLRQFELNDQARRSTVYYVSTRVTNLGPHSLSGKKITLYGKVSDSLVVPPVEFGSSFPACNYTPLPKHFGKDQSVKGCMVMLAPHHGTISEVQWRAAGETEPISWTVK